MGAFDDLIPSAGGRAGAFDDLIPKKKAAATGERPSLAMDLVRNTGPWLAEGVNTMLGAVPELVSPDGGTAEFFRNNADFWREKQSDSLQGRQKAASERIAAAGQDGVLAQAGSAVGEYADDPALAARLAVTNIPSMIPGLGLGKAAQLAGAARGLSVAQQAALATGVAGGTNAALNAGGARGEAFQDIKRTAMSRGVSEADATELALEGSKLPAAVGAATGYLSGKIGLEKALLGQPGVGSALKRAAGSFGAEMVGEQAEEVLPQVATNLAAQVLDPKRTLTDDLGRTIVDTAAGAGPTSIAAAGATGYRALRGEDAPAAAPADLSGATPAAEVLGGAPPAEAPVSDAEKALMTPRALTALDRVDAIDAELSGKPDGAPETQALRDERATLTRDWPVTVPGVESTFTTEAGARVAARYSLADADSLITSHDESLRPTPAYPPELQPRERDRAASEMQVQAITSKLDPARLGLSADAANGAPIIGADGLVESGNARTIALKRVYASRGQKAEDYKAWLRDNAATFGLSPDAIDGMAKPVLVRVRTTPVNRAEFARQANASTVAAMSPAEQARSDAKRIDVLDDLQPTEEGDFASSRDFIRRFVGRLPMTEQSAMIDAAGKLSSAGYARVRNAVLAKAYGDSPVLGRMVESMDDNMRNVSRALMMAAPRVAQMRGAIEAGTRFDADITPHLVEAVEALGQMKADGTSLADALSQSGIFGEQWSPETRGMLQFLADNARRPKKIAEFIGAYYDALDAAGDPNQGSLLGDNEAPPTADLMAAARRNTQGETNAANEAAPNPERRVAAEAAPTGADAGQRSEDAQRNRRGAEGNGAGPADRAEGAAGWVNFGPETGTLGIPRADMPQVKGEHRGALINFLEARGIGHQNDVVPAKSLKPTQLEYSRKKVDAFVESGAVGERSVLTSSDGHVLDGHHQWMGHAERGESIPIIRLGAPIRELLAAVNEFPSVRRSEGSTSARDKVRADFMGALDDLAAIASRHTRAAMLPENTPDLMPTLVKLFEAGIKEVGYGMKDLLAYVKTSIKNDPRLKAFWNKIDTGLYQKAARQAIDNVENAPAVAMIDGRPYDAARDNFTAPHIDTFLDKAVIDEANDNVKRYYTNRPPVALTAEDRAKAEALLAPLLEKAAADKPVYDQKIIDIAQRTGALGQMIAPLKGIGRAAEKLVNEEGFNLSGMKDVLRSTIVVSSYDDVQSVIDEILREFKPLRAPKNRTGGAPVMFNGQSIQAEDPARYGGYSDVLVNVVMPSGVIAEIQINVPEMLGAKEGPDRQAPGHKLYEAYREAPKESPLGQEILGVMLGYYAAAFAAAAKNSASVRSNHSRGPRESSRGLGSNVAPSSDSANQPRSGNSTMNPPSERSPNRQPGGNLLGTSIASPLEPIVPDKAQTDYTVKQDGTRNGTANDGRTGPEGQGPETARGTQGRRQAGPVRRGSGQPDLFGDGQPDAGAAGPAEVGPTGPAGVRGEDADGAGAEPRGGDGPPAGVPAGRDIAPKSGRNYRFDDTDLTYQGSWQKKAAANIDAVELLKRLQADGRQATRDEQKVLAQFIGWGAGELANNLFGKKLDKQAEALEHYDKAAAEFDKQGNRPMRREAYGRYGGTPPGYFDAFQVLAAKDPQLGYYSVTEITREQIDKARPDPATRRWIELRDRLKAALTEDEWASASRTTQYAHFTSKPIVSSMWRALERFGFKGGVMLEPGAGNGVFPGLMPEAMAASSIYTGIEYDAITGGILQQLQPDERILVESFIDSKLPKNFYDVAIGNPPFSGTKILTDPEYQKHAFSLHDYFFAKAVDRVKPGGLVMFVTSRYTMDKLNDKARAYLAERADLVGAIRLPQTAFKQNAGTDVVTDVIFLRKKVPGQTFEQAQPWAKSVPMTVGGTTFPVNEYFAANPQMVLGTHSDTGKMQNSSEPQYTVLPPDGDIEALFAAAVERMPADIYTAERGSAAEAAKVREIDWSPKAQKEGNYYVSDAGVLMQREGGIGQRVEKVKPKDAAIIKALVPLRDALKQAHYDQLTDGPWEQSLAALQAAYKAFTAAHGQVNQFTSRTVTVKVDELNEDGDLTGRKVDDEQIRRKFPVLDAMVDDPDWTLLAALEKVNEETGEITPSSFLKARVLGKPEPARIDSAHDAMLASLNDLGHIDIGTIADRAGLSEAEAIESLGSSIYLDPEGSWVTDDEYLSGNVKRKLEAARAAAKADRRYARNVTALEAAQPSPKSPADINVGIGMNWIPGSDYAQFLQDTAKVRANVSYNEATRQWVVEELAGGKTMAATADWGTGARNTTELLEHALTGRAIRITSTVKIGDEKKTVFDAAATEAANAKLEALKKEFADWIWRDADRSTRLVQAFNDKFNTTVSRAYDGRHLTMPGASKLYNIFDHVKRGAWRIVQSGNTYLAHAVGSGKTFQMVISAMEQKRLGLIKKPMMVVPNHMLAQFAREWQDLYPAARLMVADENNFHTDNRRRFVSRVALSDLDGVIITHSAFKLLDVDPAFKAKVIEEQLEYLRAALEEAEKADTGSGRKPPTVKQIEKQIENLEQKLQASLSGEGKDKNVRFDEMGVDMLYVDEAHEFRKLDFATSRQVKGIQPAGSARALDLYIKSRYLEERTPGRSLVMASGTPITNTVAELYTVGRFLGRQAMIERGVEDFDSWAAMFGREFTELEPNAAGAYEPVTRFSRFVNVPEMTAAFREYADVVTGDQLAMLLGEGRPKVEGGSRRLVVTPKSEAFATYQRMLAARVEASRKWKPSKEEPNNPDPIIKIIGDGRLAAIDMRFVDPSSPSDPDSKLNRMADDLVSKFKETANDEFLDKAKENIEPNKGATMMVFSDLGFGAGVTATRGFNARAWLEKRLRDGGVPMDKVAFMSDYKKSTAKLRLFQDMNAGRIRILIGSSKNMGTGVNAQQRLRAMFHLDSPWYPADLEQREGRIVRQGNKNKFVQIFAYATKGSYDENMWKILATKQYFIDQALSGDPNLREIEDLSNVGLLAQAAAMVAEDPRVLQLAGAKAEVEKMQRLFKAHEEQRHGFRRAYQNAQENIAFAQMALPKAMAAAEKVRDLSGDKFVAKVGRASYTDRSKWGDALLAEFKDRAGHGAESAVIGEISGTPIRFVSHTGGGSYSASVQLLTPEPSILIAYGTESPIGLAMRATNALLDVARAPARLREGIVADRAKMDALSSRLETPFPMAAMLTDKIREVAEIEAALAAPPVAAGPVVDETMWGDQAPNDPTGNTADVVLSRGGAGGIDIKALRGVAARVTAGLPGLPKVHVLASPAAAPKALADFIRARGAMGDAEGALHKGEIYLFASGIADELRAEHVLAEHEAAHAGLSGLLGRSKASVMRAIAANNATVRKAAAARTGLSLEEAVEEVIVDMPSSALAKLKGWRQVVDRARSWLASHGFTRLAGRLDAWIDGSLSDQQRADLFVADLVREARAFVGRKRGRGGDTMLSRAWHGTPHNVDKFSTKHIGTGEGAQAYGWGLYFASKREVADYYRPAPWKPESVGGEPFDASKQEHRLANMIESYGKGNRAEAIRQLRMRGFTGADVDALESTMEVRPLKLKQAGFMYQVNIAPDDDSMLLWDKPLSQQSTKVRDALRTLAPQLGPGPDQKLLAKVLNGETLTDFERDWAPAHGEQFYKMLSRQLNDDWRGSAGNDEAASSALLAAGIKGIKYLDGASRAAGDGSHNYVIFSDDDVEIEARLSRATPAPAAAERADALIQRTAGTAKPLDAAARFLTRVSGVEKGAALIYGAGAKLIDRLVPERLKAGLVSDYGVPEAVIDQRAMMQGRQRQQLRGAGTLLEKLSTLTRAESRVAYEWMSGEDTRTADALMKDLPEASVKVLEEVRALVDKLSQEAVRLGQLDTEAFDRHRFAYLRRSYVKHTAELTSADKAKRQRAISILGDQYKGRGMVDKAPMRQVQNAAPEWWKRKFVPGKADTSLKGEKLIRFERRAPSGEGTAAIEGMEGKRPGRVLEINYWPADQTPPAKYADWDRAGTWEVRGTKGGDLLVWRDFTKDERVKMGEIDEARFAIAKTLHSMIHDVEVGKYLEWLGTTQAKKPGEEIPGTIVSASESYKDTFKPGEWVQVPEVKIQGTNVLKYGKLAGRYIPGPVWNDLRQVIAGRYQPFGETYATILSYWKTVRTALSPGVHTNNVMSNMVMADWHDVTAGHVAKALHIVLGASKRQGTGALGRAGNLLARGGIADADAAREVLARYEDSGAAIGGWVTQEIRNEQLAPMIEAMQRELAGAAAGSAPAEIGVYSALQHALHARFPAAVEALKASKPVQAGGKEAKALIDLYQAEDDVFRLAAWLKAKEGGMTDADAGKVARRSFLDYSINAPWVQAMRSTALPFISFTYRAVPMLLETAGKRPHKLMKLMMVAGGLNYLCAMMMGGGDDDEVRKLLPEEKAGGVWGLVPKLIRMPWNDAYGSPVYLDIRRWVPVGDVIDTGAGHAVMGMPPALIPGGPLALAMEFYSNKLAFTGKPITLETDTTLEKTGKIIDWLWKAFTPNILGVPGTYATQGVVDAVKGRTDAFGREQSVGQAAASAFGVKVGAYPADVLRRNLVAQTNAQTAEVEKVIADLRRQRQTNRIGDEEFADKVRAQQEKAVDLRRKLAEKVQ